MNQMFRPSIIIFYQLHKVKPKCPLFFVLIYLVKPHNAKSNHTWGTEGVFFNSGLDKAIEPSVKTASHIWKCCIYHVYTVWYMCPSIPLSYSSFPHLSLSLSFLTEMLSLNHLSAFWNRRRYYETYIRYVTLGIHVHIAGTDACRETDGV